LSNPFPRRLAGQTALVTGSARGIGRTIAEWLARDGANIVVSGRELAAVEQSVTAMRALGVAAWGIPADLAHVGEAHRLAEATLSAIPGLDILVNNASMSVRGRIWEVSDGKCEEQVNVEFRHHYRWFFRRRTYWDADHIVPVAEGGGECMMANIRTLCFPCHQHVTKEQARNRASHRRQERLGHQDGWR